jgi:hypothetical protein
MSSVPQICKDGAFRNLAPCQWSFLLEHRTFDDGFDKYLPKAPFASAKTLFYDGATGKLDEVHDELWVVFRLATALTITSSDYL